MNEKFVKKIGWLASFLATAVFLSFFDQIRLNLAGQKGSILIPIITFINCSTWCLYGFLKTPKDYPIIICNIIGIIVGFITTLTALI